MIIDIYGSPGCGKSSTAKILSGLLSANGFLIETTEEYPKFLVHKEDFKSLENQLGIFRDHKLRIDTTINKYDFLISDSPTLMQLVYIREQNNGKKDKILEKLVKREHKKHKRISILLNRKHDYKMIGRVHTEEESEIKHKEIKELLKKNKVKFYEFDTHELIGFEIFDFLNKKFSLIDEKNKNKILKKRFKKIRNIYQKQKSGNLNDRK